MADCGWLDLVCKGAEGITEMAGNAVAQLAEQVMIGVSDVLVSLGTAWVNTPSVNLESNAARKFITEHVQFLVLALLAGAIIFVGIRIVWTRRLEPLQEIMAGVFQFLVISLGGIKIMSMLINAADEFSAWIIDQAVGDSGGFGASLLTVLAVGNVGVPGLGAIVLIIGGIIALIANLIQVGLLFVRSALLILLAAVIVLPAAMPGSTMGKEWLKKLGGWFLAFVLFKPAASIIYATGIMLIDGKDMGGGDKLIAFAMGVLFLVLAPVALPALMAFIVPSVSALSAGGGGAGVAMAAGSLASGAANVASGSGAGSEGPSHSSQSDTSSSNESTSSATGANPGASSDTGSPSGSPVGSTGGSPGGSPGQKPGGDSSPGPGGETPSGGGAPVSGGPATTGGAASTGAASVGAGAASGGTTMAVQAAAQGAQEVTGAVQSVVDSETSGATGAGETDE